MRERTYFLDIPSFLTVQTSVLGIGLYTYLRFNMDTNNGSARQPWWTGVPSNERSYSMAALERDLKGLTLQKITKPLQWRISVTMCTTSDTHKVSDVKLE